MAAIGYGCYWGLHHSKSVLRKNMGMAAIGDYITAKVFSEKMWPLYILATKVFSEEII